MKLSGIEGGSRLLHAAVINQAVNRGKKEDMSQAVPAISQRNRDSVLISAQGKQKSILQQLMDQKQLIQESRDAEMERGLEEGYINQEKIDEYDEQLKEIDKQIAEALVREAGDEDGQEESENNSGLKTKEEYMQSRMVDLAAGMDQAEFISSVQEKLDGEARILKSEIRSDGSRALDSKRDRLREIESRSDGLTSMIGEKISDIHEEEMTEKNNSATNEITEESENLAGEIKKEY